MEVVGRTTVPVERPWTDADKSAPLTDIRMASANLRRAVLRDATVLRLASDVARAIRDHPSIALITRYSAPGNIDLSFGLPLSMHGRRVEISDDLTAGAVEVLATYGDVTFVWCIDDALGHAANEG